MASERVGFVEADQGDVHVRLIVDRIDACTRLTMGIRKDGRTITRPFALLDDEKLDALRELLDRAAMPGQVSGLPFPCCEHCKHQGDYGEGHVMLCAKCDAEAERLTEADGVSG